RPIPWFDRDNHPFVPTCLPAERRAQWKSPRRGRSTAEHRALARLTERARRYTPIQGTAPPPLRGYCPAMSLTTGGESPPILWELCNRRKGSKSLYHRNGVQDWLSRRSDGA